jgi:phosphoribosylanthranilate isomerase
MIKIKVCGITRVDDALAAAQQGVDALGFIFVKASPRYITPQAAAVIIKTLPPFISRVGVFADEDSAIVNSTARIAGVDTVQLHGAETVDYCKEIVYPVIKALGLRPDFDYTVLEKYPVAGILLDTWNKGLQGGTGRCGDWTIARRAAEHYERIILAGGLGPSNLEAALNEVQPYGVDVNSGVEIQPGVKNLDKIRDAVRIVKNWQPIIQ